MPKCPECGEKIAEIDVFCPYCGITLEPIVQIEQDPSMSETIVGNTSDFLPESKIPEADPEPEADQIPEMVKFPNAENEPLQTPPEDSVTHKTAENWSMNTDSVELPEEFLADNSDSNPSDVQTEQENPFEIKTEVEEQKSESTKQSPEDFVDFNDLFENIPVPKVLSEVKAQNDFVEALSVEEKANNIPEIKSEDQTEFVDQTKTELTRETQPDDSITMMDESDEPQMDSELEPDFDGKELSEPAGNIDIASLLMEEPPLESNNWNVDSEPKNSDVEQNIEPEQENPVVEQNVDFPVDVPKIKDEEEISQIFEETPSVIEEPEFLADEKVEIVESVKETDSSDILMEPKKAEESSQSSIDMPETPLELEGQDDQMMFDSVQIIQNNKPNYEKSADVENPVVVQSFTQQNMGSGDTDGRKGSKLQPLEEGTILNNRYEVVRKIGGGGMGAVYLANDRNLGGILRAVKEMVQSYIESEQHDKAISDFQREALILSNLDHTSIPTIYDYFFDETAGRFYLVMRYISGGDLAGRLRSAPEGRIDEKTVTEWAIQIADVLDYLHKQDPVIVYRDLKPANIMIDGNSGRVMLIDFGIARSINKEEKGVTAVGTMGYAPPELFSGNVEPRSDIYSLGSTIFHLLTGADPQSNPLLIFDFQKNPRPRQINSQLSDQIEQIVMRAVEYNSDMRFTSAAEMRDALQEHLENLKNSKISFGVNSAPSAVGFSEQPVFCGFCGKQIVASDVFCAFCGSQQPIAQQSFQHQAAAFVAPSGTAKLFLMVTGELDPSSFGLDKNENLIGRRDPMSNIFPEIDLSKYDPQTKISRRHARIWRDGNNFMIEDLGSSNGTILTSGSEDSLRLLPHQPRNLSNGDKLKIGDTTLHFTVG